MHRGKREALLRLDDQDEGGQMIDGGILGMVHVDGCEYRCWAVVLCHDDLPV